MRFCCLIDEVEFDIDTYPNGVYALCIGKALQPMRLRVPRLVLSAFLVLVLGAGQSVCACFSPIGNDGAGDAHAGHGELVHLAHAPPSDEHDHGNHHGDHQDHGDHDSTPQGDCDGDCSNCSQTPWIKSTSKVDLNATRTFAPEQKIIQASIASVTRQTVHSLYALTHMRRRAPPVLTPVTLKVRLLN